MICAMVSYALMNLVMTSTPLAIVGCGFATARRRRRGLRPRAGDVRALVLHRHLIARFGAERVIAAGLVILAAAGAVGALGRDARAFLRRADPARARLELRLHRRDGDADRRAHPRGARPGAGHERLRGLRPRRRRLARLGRADELLRRRRGRRLDRGQPRHGAVPRRRRRRADLARAAPPRRSPAPAERPPGEAGARTRSAPSRARRGRSAPDRPPRAAARARPASPAAAPAPPRAAPAPRCARARASAASPSRARASTATPGGSGSRPRARSSGSARRSAAVPAPRAKSRTTGSAAPSAAEVPRGQLHQVPGGMVDVELERRPVGMRRRLGIRRAAPSIISSNSRRGRSAAAIVARERLRPPRAAAAACRRRSRRPPRATMRAGSRPAAARRRPTAPARSRG